MRRNKIVAMFLLLLLNLAIATSVDGQNHLNGKKNLHLAVYSISFNEKFALNTLYVFIILQLLQK